MKFRIRMWLKIWRNCRREHPLAFVALLIAFSVGTILLSNRMLAAERAQTSMGDIPPSPPAAKASDESQKRLLQQNSCDDLRVLVDLKNPLPRSYVPQDLVSLSSYGIPLLGEDMLLRHEATEHLSRLMEQASAAGEELIVGSAYRSFEDQEVTFDNYTALYGEGAGGVSAPPGHSQHQLGTAVDFTNRMADYELWQPFGDTSASKWLLKHAKEHGFVLSYPGGQEAETGYNWEPWHYRYIGIANIRRMEASGLSLQSFLAREGVLPRCYGSSLDPAQNTGYAAQSE